MPKNQDNFDANQVSNDWKDEVEKVDLKDVSTQNMFIGYFYDATLQNMSKPASTLPSALHDQSLQNLSRLTS